MGSARNEGISRAGCATDPALRQWPRIRAHYHHLPEGGGWGEGLSCVRKTPNPCPAPLFGEYQILRLPSVSAHAYGDGDSPLRSPMAGDRRWIVGCMTGTSIDALDAAIVAVDGHGLELRATFVDAATDSLGDLAPRLRALANQ